MPRGLKLCKHCTKRIGARAKTCKHCGKRQDAPLEERKQVRSEDGEDRPWFIPDHVIWKGKYGKGYTPDE